MKVALFSDLHIGSVESQWRDVAEVINQIASDLDAVIIAGDTTEEINPYKETIDSAKKTEGGLGAKVEAELADFVSRIDDHINRTVFLRGNHDDQMLNRRHLVENFAVMNSKFGRVVVLHGHQTNLTRYGLKLGWGVQAGRELKSNLDLEHSNGINLEETDYLIVGHCYVAYYDNYSKIYSLGCWKGNYSNRNTGWYMIIDDETHESPKNFIKFYRKPITPFQQICSCGFNGLVNDDLVCPNCERETTPKCERPNCGRPLRGEEEEVCKRHGNGFKFWE